MAKPTLINIKSYFTGYIINYNRWAVLRSGPGGLCAGLAGRDRRKILAHYNEFAQGLGLGAGFANKG